jgi:hypothetical protein
MSYLRVKTITKKNSRQYKYLYRQKSVHQGKKVHTISEFLGPLLWIPLAAMSPGSPGGYGASRPTDKRQIRDQEAGDRELFAKNRAAFNVKQRQDYDRQQKTRDAAKEAREAKMSRSERRERDEARAEAQSKWDEGMEAVREFNEARGAEKASS